jgi:hypothetical protein
MAKIQARRSSRPGHTKTRPDGWPLLLFGHDDPCGITQFSNRNLDNRSALRPRATCQCAGRNSPEQTRLSARREDLQKNTQRRNGVRMRHRRTIAQRNRNGRGMGDTPSWRQNTDACCYSRALLATLFLQRIGPECRFCRPACLPALLLFINHLSFALRPISRLLPALRKPGSCTRRNEICNRQCGAAPSRRAHEISPGNPNEHRT